MVGAAGLLPQIVLGTDFVFTHRIGGGGAVTVVADGGRAII